MLVQNSKYFCLILLRDFVRLLAIITAVFEYFIKIIKLKYILGLLTQALFKIVVHMYSLVCPQIYFCRTRINTFKNKRKKERNLQICVGESNYIRQMQMVFWWGKMIGWEDNTYPRNIRCDENIREFDLKSVGGLAIGGRWRRLMRRSIIDCLLRRRNSWRCYGCQCLKIPTSSFPSYFLPWEAHGKLSDWYVICQVQCCALPLIRYSFFFLLLSGLKKLLSYFSQVVSSVDYVPRMKSATKVRNVNLVLRSSSLVSSDLLIFLTSTFMFPSFPTTGVLIRKVLLEVFLS